MDLHEPVHSDLYAGELIDRRRHELVAGDPHDISREHDRAGTHGVEWPCRRKIWDTISCVGTRELRRAIGKPAGYPARDRCMRMVWDTDVDRGIRFIPDDGLMDPIA